jgi:hypothetical protein
MRMSPKLFLTFNFPDLNVVCIEIYNLLGLNAMGFERSPLGLRMNA